MVIKQRSPNYPGIALSEAVDAVKRLYPKVQRGEFTPNDAPGPLGYNSMSGNARRKLGALKQYGFIDQTRGENAKLSTRALTICLRNPASEEYRTALKEAALEPPLFKEFYDSGKYTASDDALRQELIVKRSFTDGGASLFIEVLRATLDFANLSGYDKISGLEQDKVHDEGGVPVNAPAGSTLDVRPPDLGAKSKVYHIPFRVNADVNLEGPFPLTKKDWERVMKVIEAMKPSLVLDEEEQPDAAMPKATTPAPIHSAATKTRLSAEAQELLSAVEAGGLPMTMNPKIEKIANDYGIPVTGTTTPNEVVEQLRRLSLD